MNINNIAFVVVVDLIKKNSLSSVRSRIVKTTNLKQSKEKEIDITKNLQKHFEKVLKNKYEQNTHRHA